MMRRYLSTRGPVQREIEQKLGQALSIQFIKIDNESHMHNVPKDSETHFRVELVSREFEGMSLVQRHRRINSILAEELRNGVHALSIDARAPEQSDSLPKSPTCRGGANK